MRKDLDDEAIRVSKFIHYEIPAMQKGKAIRVMFTIPVQFKQDEIENKNKFKH